MKRLFQKTSSGQVGLIILLLMVVMMTVGISVATRSTGELSLSRSEEESSRAFDAAEAGIEEGLQKISLNSIGNGSVVVGNITADYTITPNNSITKTLGVGEVTEVKVAGASKLNLTWSTPSAGTCSNGEMPAVVVAVYRENQVKRTAYDTCAARRSSNNFSNPGATPNVEITLNSAQDKIARIKVLYGPAELEVSGNNLPAQSYTIDSTARAVNGETRVVQLERGLGAAPAILDYVLFAGESIN